MWGTGLWYLQLSEDKTARRTQVGVWQLSAWVMTGLKCWHLISWAFYLSTDLKSSPWVDEWEELRKYTFSCFREGRGLWAHMITIHGVGVCCKAACVWMNPFGFGSVVLVGKEVKFKVKVISHSAMKLLQGSTLALPREETRSLQDTEGIYLLFL